MEEAAAIDSWSHCNFLPGQVPKKLLQGGGSELEALSPTGSIDEFVTSTLIFVDNAFDVAVSLRELHGP